MTVHIVNSRLLTKFEGGLTILHEAEDDAVNWLNSVATTNSSAVVCTNLHKSLRRLLADGLQNAL